MDVKEVFPEFSAILSEDAIVKLAKEYRVEDKRKRKLAVVPFFWLIVLSAIESAPRGCLSKLVAFITASFSLIYPNDQVTGLSRMALSKKLSSTNWMFFRGVYNRLLTCYINSLEPDERFFFARFKDCFAVDGSVIRLNKFNTELRLDRILHEGEWRFYVTNIFDAIFTPQVIYELYSKRWNIEIFFNDIKHILKLSHILSKNKNGIMVEIYSALIFYLLVRIMTAIAAESSGRKITDFSFKKSVEIFSAFFLTQLPELILGTKAKFIAFF